MFVFHNVLFAIFAGKKALTMLMLPQINDYKSKVDEMYLLGGDQLLLQGGMNPELDLEFL